MTLKNLNFQDSIVVEQSIPDGYKSDAGEMLRRDRGTKLRVEIDATHSGVLTNMRVYPSKFVRDGYRSFMSKERGGTAEYDKPILRHHDDLADPIGRVVDARYSPLKYGDAFELDYLTPDNIGSKGSGVVTITALITDADAISKIIDSRYFSVSAGHSSPTYLCSACGDSIMECEHMPGKRYSSDSEEDEDGRLCYIITGPMTYNETSFVNIPAQPPAKLTNFSWTDSKDDWGKKVITSQIAGKKEAVRNFILCDEDGELSLLNGKKTSSIKKTVIAVSPAVADKLKHALSSDQPKADDVTPNVRNPVEAKESGVLGVEQNLEKAKNLDTTSKKEATMDEKKLTDLETEVNSLKDQLSTAETAVNDLKKQLEGKDSQIQRLTTDATATQTKMAKSLAYSLASIKIRLKKPGSEDLDTKDKQNAYIEKLASRSIESLQDSIEDILQELNSEPVEVKTTDAGDLMAKDKVTSPTLSKGDKPKVVETKKTSTPKRGVDVLAKTLGIGE